MLGRSVSSRIAFVVVSFTISLLGQAPISEGRLTLLRARSSYDAGSSTGLQVEPEASEVKNTRPGSSTVTLQRLKHAVSGKAIKQFDKAEKARLQGHIQEAIAHLIEAVRIDPDFVAARTNLAALYISLDKQGPALEQLEPALKMDPHDAKISINLALAYMLDERMEAAEVAARRAVDLERTGNRAALILGIVLVTRSKFTQETLDLVHRAERDYPQAHLLAARVLAGLGESEEAKAELKTYLATGDAVGRGLANYWMAAINNAQQPNAVTARNPAPAAGDR